MTFVTVFRRVPKPITGMIGVLYDPDFERFEANLDWLGERIGGALEAPICPGRSWPAQSDRDRDGSVRSPDDVAGSRRRV